MRVLNTRLKQKGYTKNSQICLLISVIIPNFLFNNITLGNYLRPYLVKRWYQHFKSLLRGFRAILFNN